MPRGSEPRLARRLADELGFERFGVADRHGDHVVGLGFGDGGGFTSAGGRMMVSR
jgi:hypothetical protein